MNTDGHRLEISRLTFVRALVFFPVALLLVTGCVDRPSKANIELRKRIQLLEDQAADQKRHQEADAATIRALQREKGTVQTLPQDRVDKLFTVHGISVGRLTGGADLDPTRPGDEGIKVYATPIDDQGQPLKAAGSFVVELLDPASPPPGSAGRWEFTTDQARQNWFGRLLLYNYVLTCPWQAPPGHSELTLKVTFTDELTQRQFSAQTVIKVNLPR
jgi:hypothetical protein